MAIYVFILLILAIIFVPYLLTRLVEKIWPKWSFTSSPAFIERWWCGIILTFIFAVLIAGIILLLTGLWDIANEIVL